ncbi:hypothetical protein [Mesorhizobium abyssinicae]|uniref:hypothetical protein n=1 Tax=Mesorhizobium abyssinicae TaxID=1209958 RepID=UPI0033977310
MRALQSFGERLSASHGLAASNKHLAEAAALNNITADRYLWSEGIGAEAANPRSHATESAFLNVLRNFMADWADFDIAAVHYSYGLTCFALRIRASSCRIPFRIKASRRRPGCVRGPLNHPHGPRRTLLETVPVSAVEVVRARPNGHL